MAQTSIHFQAVKGGSEKRMKTKLTKQERNWILYDVGNSAFVLLVATIMPIYFNYLAGNGGLSSVEYMAYWGYAASAATLVVAVLGPVLGTLADTKGYKKPIFLISLLVGAVGCITLGFAKQWLIFLSMPKTSAQIVCISAMSLRLSFRLFPLSWSVQSATR